jgi:hypothetical protein
MQFLNFFTFIQYNYAKTDFHHTHTLVCVLNLGHKELINLINSSIWLFHLKIVIF